MFSKRQCCLAWNQPTNLTEQALEPQLVATAHSAQTQRSLKHFNIGNERMPKEAYHAYGYMKNLASQQTNERKPRHERSAAFRRRAGGLLPG